jgi:hypothetical protein
MRFLSAVLLIPIASLAALYGQIYEHPNYSLNSHPTLDVTSVERWEDQMVVNLTIKNERYSGSFCIDSNTVLLNSLGNEEYRLRSMEGIPACPETYRFKSVGERISMILVFPAVPDEVRYIDLVERCDEACVNIQYILLDEDMNARLNEGIRLFELGRPEASLQVFEEIMNTEYDGISPVYGTVFLYLVAIHYELGNSKDARAAFNQLQESSIIGRDDFIETARESGIIR